MKSVWIVVCNGKLFGVFKTKDEALDYFLFEWDKDFDYDFFRDEDFDVYEIKPGQNSGKYCREKLSYDELKRMVK